MIPDDIKKMDRARLAAARDLLIRWDRNHASAQRRAIDMESRSASPVVYRHMPETTYASEYMPGRRKLLEAADQNDQTAAITYAAAAFDAIWSGPYMYMPLAVFEIAARHDDLRAKWARTW